MASLRSCGIRTPSDLRRDALELIFSEVTIKDGRLVDIMPQPIIPGGRVRPLVRTPRQ